MVDNLQNAGPQDRAGINVHVRWELARAVKVVRRAVSEVREYLRK